MIILKMNCFCSPEDYQRTHKELADQLESGLLVLPPHVSFVHADTNNNETVSILKRNGEIVHVERNGASVKEVAIIEDGTPVLGGMKVGVK